jgi:cell cycle arrest protein BUB3
MKKNRFPAGVTSLAFDNSSTILAIGSSYNYENGELADKPKDNIFIKRIEDVDIKPK